VNQNWALIGLIVGMVLGISGAGGGIITVPLLMSLAGVTLAQATGLSPIAVFIGAGIHAYSQRKNLDLRVSLSIFVFSSLGAAVISPLKPHLPSLRRPSFSQLHR
jgi:uncharacterized membrane protein YfcA